MKRIICLFLLLWTFIGFAQDHSDEKIKSLKTAYITETLELSSKEAEKFWPIYNEFERKTDSLYEEKWCNVKNGLEIIDTLDEETSEELLQEYLSMKSESVTLKKEFVNRLKTVISSTKILKLKKAEHDFHKILLEKYGEKKD
ncbi:hypothetical protein [Mesonia maritima]|uniref:Sensor of ECF-type sigma factor n=1 Tax=Mesonia maritima TaxID=1793873 RepID=A0ABU1K8I7_9FLAO|nr:hypothetical protein [Mesonia maritima]MDR6300797.1 hypothetical protein [Mesonia maritima]